MNPGTVERLPEPVARPREVVPDGARPQPRVDPDEDDVEVRARGRRGSSGRARPRAPPSRGSRGQPTTGAAGRAGRLSVRGDARCAGRSAMREPGAVRTPRAGGRSRRASGPRSGSAPPGDGDPGDHDRELASRDERDPARMRPRRPMPARRAAIHPVPTFVAAPTIASASAAGSAAGIVPGSTSNPKKRKKVPANTDRSGTSSERARSAAGPRTRCRPGRRPRRRRRSSASVAPAVSSNTARDAEQRAPRRSR